MTTNPANIPTEPAALAARIEALVKLQLDALSLSNMERLVYLSNELDATLAHAKAAEAGISPDAVSRIADLQNRLAMALTDQKVQAEAQLKKMRGGQKMLKAYGGR